MDNLKEKLIKILENCYGVYFDIAIKNGIIEVIDVDGDECILSCPEELGIEGLIPLIYQELSKDMIAECNFDIPNEDLPGVLGYFAKAINQTSKLVRSFNSKSESDKVETIK